jgi:hypothetical protein
MPNRQTVAAAQHSPRKRGLAGARIGVPTDTSGTVSEGAHWKKSVAPGTRRDNADMRGRTAMALLIALGFFVLITALVLWGSTFFGPENSSTKVH